MKLTFHDACWDAAASPWADQALHAGARWLKVIDDPARAYAVATTFTKCQVIYRKVAPQDIEQLSDLRRHPEFKDVVSCAQMFVRLADIKPRPNLWVEGANEVKLETVDDAQWYGRVEAIRSMLLFDRGLGAVVGNFATGNPTEALMFHFMEAYRAAGGASGALIGQHEYGAINLPAAQDKHNLLRHRMLRKYAPGMRWAITECGLDRIQVGGQWVGGGWRAGNVSQADYWRFMLDFNAELERDSDVVCAAVFTYGDTARWKDFEMQDASEFNGELVAAISADGQQTPTVPSRPDCNRTDVPDNWTHTVEATLGLRVRSSMSTADLSNVLCSMVNGKQVRATKRFGDWMYIDFPLHGYCWAPNLKPRPAVKPPERQLGPVLALVEGDRFVDVSAWQDPADIDWPVLRMHGYKAAMIRLAAGTLTDPEWHLYAAGCVAAKLPWFGYTYFSFTVSWQSQVASVMAAIDKMAKLPTICIDLEGTNPDKGDAGLRAYINTLTTIGVPLAAYTRQSWVSEHLPQAASVIGHLPLIVANYRRPIDALPALPVGWSQAAAWQHVSGEMTASWRFAKTISGKGLDESIVLSSGLDVHAGA